VSGSPVQPNDYKRYRLTLDKIGGGKHTGFMYYCCWPCVCDTQDWIKVDTKTVTTAEGPRQYHFAVIGNACDHPEELSKRYIDTFQRYETSLNQQAAEVRCGPNGELIGATLSDHGYVIIAMFFDAPGDAGVASSVEGGQMQPGRMTTLSGVNFQHEGEFAGMCKERADGGYKSGMGEIFRKVAMISPVVTSNTLPLLPGSAPTCSPSDESCVETTIGAEENAGVEVVYIGSDPRYTGKHGRILRRIQNGARVMYEVEFDGSGDINTFEQEAWEKHTASAQQAAATA